MLEMPLAGQEALPHRERIADADRDELHGRAHDVSGPGLAGGRAGGRGDVRLNGKRIDNRKQYLLKPGDEIVLRTPGGYGPPRARDKTLAKRDRALGYVLRKKHNG
jgi:N-methylhydantoinase B/oxoprolinase/acetone carboxylase alpha subunit